VRPVGGLGRRARGESGNDERTSGDATSQR
jgi:hypothetical protein